MGVLLRESKCRQGKEAGGQAEASSERSERARVSRPEATEAQRGSG